MSLHKLTAGDGYRYLTRQTAAHDVTLPSQSGLADYYSERGERPGRWWGRGLGGLGHAFAGAGSEVTEAQMLALFGVGMHPDTAALMGSLSSSGLSPAAVDVAVRLGRAYPIHDGATEWRCRLAQRFAQFNTAEGLPRDWPVPPEERARIRSELGREMFAAEFGRKPADPRELAGYIARASRQATTAVAGYDLTFTPVKSVSVLWALADAPVARVIEAAHDAAVADTLRWIEQHALFTRSGRAGVQQIDVTGMLAAQFTHRDARSGDPNLHTHVAVSNKVQALDGRWLAIDGRVLHKTAVAASERYNTRLEAQLRDRLGLRFAARPSTDPGRRQVREVVGVSARLAEAWSARRAAIEARRAQLSVTFHTEHGRPPTTVEQIALAQQATLETRPGKHPPRSLTEQRAQWRASAERLLGAAGVQQMLADTLPRARPSHPPLTGGALDRIVRDLARTVVTTVETERATWQVTHVHGEAERRARAADLPPGQTDQVVDTVVATVLAAAVRLGAPDPVAGAPQALRRRDGQSVYEVSGTQLYTTGRILVAERRILAAAARADGRTCAARSVELALLEATANGTELNPGQIHLIRQLATNPARVQLALAPAGTGKTTAMRALTQAWRDDGGTVLGLAPSAVAAAVLRAEISADNQVHCDTLAKLIDSLTRRRLPLWAEAVDQRTLVIIDEAGMAATTDLAEAIEWIIHRGGTIRLIGDDQQLASVASGGILRDLAETHGAVTLPQVIRFRDPAEGAASLALRAGDPAAVGYYLDHHRIHVGDPTTTVEQLFTAWAADRAADRDSVMLAPTRDLVTQLNVRGRQHRLATTTRRRGRELRLADGSACSRGDPVITRHNNRRLLISPTDWVKNGDRWTVTAVRRDGSLTVRHAGTRRRVTLPADYARQHVVLGYAATIHGAQGITADTCHLLATGAETRQLLYVGLSRGRDANHLYLTVAGDGDPHTVITRDAVLPPTAVDLLTRIIGRDGAQRSAATAARTDTDPATRLTHAAARYHDALNTAAVTTLGPDRIAELDRAADTVLPDLTREPAYPTLRAHLALLAAAGHDPVAALRAAVQQRALADARDPAAILDWRLTPTSHGSADAGPLPWLPTVPSPLAAHPEWGAYLTRRADLVRDLAAEVRTVAERWTPATAPPWARPLLDRDPGLVADLAIWRSAVGVDPTDPTPAGPIPAYTVEQHHHVPLTRRVHATLGDTAHTQRRWAALADTIDRRLTHDPYWPQVADRLTAADRAGLDLADLTAAVAATAPLPDEHPSAALWWRLAGHLTPAALPAAGIYPTLRPAWTPLLTGLLGQPTADRVMADPAWPALVAAVTDAGGRHWTPTQILTTARDLLHTRPADTPLRPDQLATALVWRITALTDPGTAHPDADDPIPDDPANPPPPNEPNPSISAVDLNGLPNALPVLDADWLNSLQPPDDPNLIAPTPASADAADIDAAASALALARISAVTWVGEDPAHDALYAYPATLGGVPAGRLLELNRAALAYYVAHYPASWAADYVTERLRTNLAGSPFLAGYAPPGWTDLTNHLRHHAEATDTELLAAGLATRTRTGRLIDRFRDRLMLPIHTPNGDLVGFIGRRNPRHDTDNEANSGGPKYLNSPETSLFTKRHLLYGLHETSPMLAAGAAPVLVEGPFDAIAVTLAGRGHYAGVASLGTAFTDQQAYLLLPYLRNDTPVIVGTDHDPAGTAAAERAYWQLTARGDNPHQLRLPAGTDPAQLLSTHGADALYLALTTASPLAHALTDARIAAYADRLQHPEGRVLAARACATVIAALPRHVWHEHATRLTIAICPDSPLLLLDEVLAAGHARDRDPTSQARLQLSQHLTRPDNRTPDSWTPLANQLDTRLVHDPSWIALAAALDRLHAAGYPVTDRLPHLAAEQPLDPHHPARDLHNRLVDEHPAAITPIPANIRRLNTSPDHHSRTPTQPAATSLPPPRHRHGPTRLT